MVNIAVLGFGVVGSGVVELIKANHDKIAGSAAQEINVKYILDIRQFPDSPYKDLFINRFEIIENDPEIQIVVETIGGQGVAYEYTIRSLQAGKSVVTSNKELVASYGHQILKLAKEKNLNYLFEASVGGGIPILRPINQCLAANEINEIYGILNGTTNYILSRMFKNASSFEEALKEAREKGYAEANPAEDIQGKDTCRKICILSALSFGRHILPEQVPTTGIEVVDAEDIALAKRIGAKIKLVGRAVRSGEGKVSAYVAPHMVLGDNLLSNVEDVFNCIVVRGNAIGDTMFYGKGAGKFPTASAVVADIIDAAKHFHARKYIYWEAGGDDAISDSGLLENRWYIRAGFTAVEAADLFVNITIIDEKNEALVFTTDMLSERELKNRLDGKAVKACYRILD
jgi:homoserine dehydrogenase